MRLKRKLLIEYNGILTVLSALSDPEEEDDVVRAIESLTFLISNSSLRLTDRKDFSELFIGKEELIEFQRDSACFHGSRRESTDKLEIPSSKRKKTEDMLTSEKNNHKPVAVSKNEKAEVLEFSGKRQKVDIDSSEPVFGNAGCRYEDAEVPHDIVLKLESGETIGAHRRVLSSVSDVFLAMLSSDYMEAKQPEVIVKDVNYFVLLFLVHYAYGCQWYFRQDTTSTTNTSCSLCTVFKKCLENNHLEANFDFLTDLLVCADRFLLDGLKSQCEQLMTLGVNEKLVVDAYLSGACYHAPVLRDFSLKYIFLGNLNLRCVYKCIKRLLESEERQFVLNDLKRIALCCF